MTFKIIWALSVLIPSVVSTSVIAGYWATRYFPWWSDGGNWLKHVNAIFGYSYPMWNEGTYQYPPIFFVLTGAVAALMGNPIIALKLVALVSFFTFPIAMYFLSKKMFGSLLAGILVAWLTAFFPLFLEFMGWGGYPNILGFTFLSLTFYFAIRYVEKGKVIAANLILTAAAITAVIFTHHLTSLLLLGTLFFWLLLSIAFKGVERKYVGVLLLVALSIFLMYRLIWAWPTDFSFHNVAAWYRLRTIVNLHYIFNNGTFLVSTIIAIALSIPAIIRMKIQSYKARLMMAWVMTPLISTQGYLFNIGLDYNRMFFFVFQPLLLLTSAIALLVNPRELAGFLKITSQSFNGGEKHSNIVCLTSVVLIGLLACLSVYIGIVTANNINSWYNFKDPYGDYDKFRAVDWLAKNSDPHDTIVAEEPIGRWIEGYCKRRVLLHTPSWFLFMKGEVEREHAARSLLTSQFGIKAAGVWILEQAPYGCSSPTIAFNHLGAYVNALFLSAKHSYISLAESDQKRIVTLDNSDEVSWLSRSNPEASLVITHRGNPVEISEKISLNRGQVVTVSLNITRLPETVEIESVTLNFTFTGEIPVYDYYSKDPSTLCILTEAGELRVVCNSSYVIADLSPHHFAVAFKNQTSLELQISLEKLEGITSDLETYTWREIADRYAVRYVVLPKFSFRRTGSIENNRSVPSEYSHLLNSPVLTVAYENKRVIILEYHQS